VAKPFGVFVCVYCIRVSVEEDVGVRDTTPSWCVMRECGLELLIIQLVSHGNSAVHFLTKSNSYTV